MTSFNDIPTMPSIIRGHRGSYALEGLLVDRRNTLYRGYTPDGTPCIAKKYCRDYGSLSEPYPSYRVERHILKIIQEAGGHKNILAPIEFIEDNGNAPCIIIFPFIAGMALSDFTEKRKEKNKNISDKDLAGIIAPICDALLPRCVL